MLLNYKSYNFYYVLIGVCLLALAVFFIVYPVNAVSLNEIKHPYEIPNYLYNYFNSFNFTVNSNSANLYNSTNFTLNSNYTNINGATINNYNMTAINESYAYLYGRANGQVLVGGGNGLVLPANVKLARSAYPTTPTLNYLEARDYGTGSMELVQQAGNLAISTNQTGNQAGNKLSLNVYGGNTAIGANNVPARTLSVYNATSPTAIQIANSYSGISATDGLVISETTADAYVWNYEAGDMGFATSNSRRATITALGSFGYGTSSPTAQLHTTGTVRFANFGAGTATFDAGGNISSVSDEKFKTNILPLKTNNKAPAKTATQKIMDLIPVCWNYNAASGLDTNNRYCGFVAQQVETAGISEAVYTKDDVRYDTIEPKEGSKEKAVTTITKLGTTTKTVDERGIIDTMVLAIQEQQATIEVQQKQIDELKTRLDKAGIRE